MAYAAVKILDGYGEKPIPIKKADEFLDFISDLAGDFVENDTSLQEVGQDAGPTLLSDTLKHSGEKRDNCQANSEQSNPIEGTSTRS